MRQIRLQHDKFTQHERKANRIIKIVINHIPNKIYIKYKRSITLQDDRAET